MRKNIFLFLSVLYILLVGCNNASDIEGQTIIESIVLNQSTYEDVKNILPEVDFKQVYNVNTNIFELADGLYAQYTINNVSGELRFDFDENDKLIHVLFSPSDYSKESGDFLKTWLFEKYKDYEQTTKDTGFIFSNGTENIELYITENPIDNTKYHGLYIEWTLVE